MKAKKMIFGALIFAAATAFVWAGDSIFTNHYAARNFIAGEVGAAQLDAILEAGVHAPSAMNKQPWHFTVVRDQALARQIISGMASGNVVIAISAPDSVIKKGTAVFDCGLAAESMYLAAQTLGLGSRIYTGPVESVNSRLKERLELPRDFSVVALVRIGLVEKVDAVSAASSRQSVDSKVNYK